MEDTVFTGTIKDLMHNDVFMEAMDKQRRNDEGKMFASLSLDELLVYQMAHSCAMQASALALEVVAAEIATRIDVKRGLGIV